MADAAAVGGPLAGVRVLDLSHVLAGPYATYHLALLGAEVIKIEKPPAGDAIRDLETRPGEGGVTAAFQGVNAGKRAIALDLSKPEGRAVLERLAPTAQVFLENFRPGRMARLGFGPERVAALNPKIVYASISAWGQAGDHADRPGYDHVMQAATGMMWLQGDDPEAPPVKVGFPAIDMAAGLVGAMAVMAGLMRRRAGDTGPIVLDVSMADAALALISAPASRYLMEGAAPPAPARRARAGGCSPPPRGGSPPPPTPSRSSKRWPASWGGRSWPPRLAGCACAPPRRTPSCATAARRASRRR